MAPVCDSDDEPLGTILSDFLDKHFVAYIYIAIVYKLLSYVL
jgi:hypothetical protein